MYTAFILDDLLTMIPQGVGNDAKVAHKTGDIAKVIADVGLVNLPNGRNLIIAAMVERQGNNPEAEKLIREVAKLVADEYRSKPKS